MKTKLPLLTVSALLAGTAFAWYTIYTDFSRFFSYGGDWLQFSGTLFPHPATTTCFYGGFAFLAALIWAVGIRRMRDSVRRVRQWLLLVSFLIAGVLFAWTNAGLTLVKFYTAASGEGVSCSGVLITNPFTTPCFIGASLFLLSLIISVFAYRALRADVNQDTRGMNNPTTGGTAEAADTESAGEISTDS